MKKFIALLAAALLCASPALAVSDSTLMEFQPTYAASLPARTSATVGTGVFFSICGSATKTVKVWRFGVGGSVNTTAVLADVALKKTSTATSAGTPVALTVTPLDSASAAGTATANFYSTLATAGTPVGTVANLTGILPTAVTGVSNNPLFIDFAVGNSGPVVLRGTAQCLEANFGTSPGNTPTLTVQVLWTEE